MNSFSISKRLALGAAAFLAVLAPTTFANTQEDDREIRTRDRQTYEVIVGDYYTGRSPYFKSLLEENPAKHPIIILKDVPFTHLSAILEFMYAGEVNVAQDQLPAFLKTAERLKVKGLAEAPQTIKQE